MRTLPPILILLGCNLFDLPKPPSPSQEGKEIYPDEPQKVLINLKNSLELLYDKNVYIRCYSEDFTFQPDRSLPFPMNQPYDITQEEAIISNILYSLDFSAKKPSYVRYEVLSTSIYPDSAYIKAIFEFRFAFRDKGERFSRSAADLYFRRNLDGRWIITYWQDIKLDTTSFAEIKFDFK